VKRVPWWVLISVTIVGVVTAVFGFYGDASEPVSAGVLAATAVVLAWTAIESSKLRDATVEASRAGYRPYVFLDCNPGIPQVHNMGLGPAVDVRIEWPEVAMPVGLRTPRFDPIAFIPITGMEPAAFYGWYEGQDRREVVPYRLDLPMNAATPTEPLDVVVRFRDIGLFEYAVTFRCEGADGRGFRILADRRAEHFPVPSGPPSHGDASLPPEPLPASQPRSRSRQGS
jgi:hypothetical protein